MCVKHIYIRYVYIYSISWLCHLAALWSYATRYQPGPVAQADSRNDPSCHKLCLKIGHTMAYPPCIDIYSTDQYCNEHDSMRNHRVLEYPIFIEAAMSMQNTLCSGLVERNGPSLAF